MRTILFLFILLLPGRGPAQLVLTVTGIPASTPPGADLYVAGTFNGWQPGTAGYHLERNAGGGYVIQLAIPPGTVEFKITRGNWQTVEGGAGGGVRPNRSVDYRGGRQQENLVIQSWEDLDRRGDPGSTAAPNVRVVSTDFAIPQLNNRPRRIWVYLPPDYERQPDRRYPVLYMHDAQNLFDARLSFSGEWQVDETLNRLFGNGDKGVIVVGVDNGGARRLNEYAPWVNPAYGGGEGDEYGEFIARTLKPFIDRSFRTLAAREYTGVAGSSLGGLISLYIAVQYQDVFGKAGILSPSLWFSEEAFAHILRTGRQKPLDVYLMAGRREGAGVVADLYALENTLELAGFDPQRVISITHADGQHSEWYWAREFGDVYRWLFTNWPETDRPDAHPRPVISLSGSRSRPRLRVSAGSAATELSFRLTTPAGAEILRLDKLPNGRTVRLPPLPAGTYFAYVSAGSQLLAAQRLGW